MNTANETSRLAGLLYLIVVATGIFSLAYVPSQITVPNDPPATDAKIIALEPLFRLGIASFLVNQVAFLLLPLVLYQLFAPVSHRAAVLMVALAVVSVPVSLASVAHRLDALSLLTNPYHASAFAPAHLAVAAKIALDAYRNGLLVANLFWGLWLLPFGYLVWKSGFLPRLLGILLMLGCFGYMANVFGEVLIPGYAGISVSGYARLPAAVGEIGTCLWLLLVGSRPPKGRP